MRQFPGEESLRLVVHASRLAVKDITRWFIDRYGDEYDRKVTTKWIGSLLRKKLQLRPYKSHGVFVIAVPDPPTLERLYEKYGMSPREPEEETGDAPGNGPAADRVDMGTWGHGPGE